MNTTAQTVILHGDREAKLSNSSSGRIIKLVVAPGPLGLYVKGQSDGNLRVYKITENSQCKGTIQENDILVWIDDMKVSDLGPKSSLRYLEKRLWESKTLVFVRPYVHGRTALESYPLGAARPHSGCDNKSKSRCDSIQINKPGCAYSYDSTWIEGGNENKMTLNNDISQTFVVGRQGMKQCLNVHCNGDTISGNDDHSYCTFFQVHAHPGTLGLNIKPWHSFGFQVIFVREDSQCKGKVCVGDVILSINDLLLCNMNKDAVVEYLKERISLSNILYVKRFQSLQKSVSEVGNVVPSKKRHRDETGTNHENHQSLNMLKETLPGWPRGGQKEKSTHHDIGIREMMQPVPYNTTVTAAAATTTTATRINNDCETIHGANTLQKSFSNGIQEAQAQKSATDSSCIETNITDLKISNPCHQLQIWKGNNLTCEVGTTCTDTLAQCSGDESLVMNGTDLQLPQSISIDDGDQEEATEGHDLIILDNSRGSEPAFDPSMYTHKDFLKFRDMSKRICKEMEKRQALHLEEVAARIFGMNSDDEA